MRLEGKVALITGATRGIGKAIALLLAEEGAKLAIAARNADKSEELIACIEELGSEAIFVKADVSKKPDVARMVETTLDTFGSVDILVSNAGIHEGAPFSEESEGMWQRLFLVNVMGTVLPCQQVVPEMKRKGEGAIVLVSSKAAVVGEPNHAAYSASKGAISALTRALAIELAPHHIKVNAVCPGPTRTDMLFGAVPSVAQREELAAAAPLGRLGEPEDIAGAVLFLASPLSDWCTGQAISVDGGMSILR